MPALRVQIPQVAKEEQNLAELDKDRAGLQSVAEAAVKKVGAGLEIRREWDGVTSYIYIVLVLGCMDADLCD